MPSRKATRVLEAEDWMSRIRDSSHDVVLAGLASLARASGADRKGAQADFKTLVAEGRRLEPRLHDAARKAWSEWVDRPAGPASPRPDGRLQGVFEERVTAVLVRLGVPSREEIADLRAKVERLLARESHPGDPAAGSGKRPTRVRRGPPRPALKRSAVTKTAKGRRPRAV